MTGGVLGFVVAAIVIPLLVNEAGDLTRSLARCLLRWGARRIGRAEQAERYEEEWLADLERIPGSLTRLIYASGVVVRSVPRLRAQFRRDPRRARLPGALADRTLDAIGQQLAVSAEIDATLQHVADLLVPQFADHCFIDLFHGDALICRVRQHAGDWTPPPGTWKLAGEQIRYPQGHFCQLAMERLDTILVADLEDDTSGHYPPPSAESMVASKQVKMRSVVAAPLYARGSLLGVLAVARSDLTSRTDRNFTPADRDLISAVAGQIAIAIDNAATARRRAQDRPGPAAIAPATS
jgi:GAF domain-containing protein